MSATAQINRYLPHDPEQALHSLMKITKKLIDLADREMQALAISDMLAFAVMQDEKQRLAQRYSFMSQEFRQRIPEFRMTEKGLLDRLDALQKQLGDVMRNNNKIIAKMEVQARQNTQSTLLTAQELASKCPLEFPDRKPTVQTAQEAAA